MGQIEKIRHSSIVTSEIRRKNPVTMIDRVERFSNFASINLALKYCRRTIKEIENMRLLPQVDELLVISLRSGIPDTQEMISNLPGKSVVEEDENE